MSSDRSDVISKLVSMVVSRWMFSDPFHGSHSNGDDHQLPGRIFNHMTFNRISIGKMAL